MIHATVVTFDKAADVQYSSRGSADLSGHGAPRSIEHERFRHAHTNTIILWHLDNEEITLADAEAFLQENEAALLGVAGETLRPVIVINYPDNDTRSAEHKYIPANSSRQEDLSLRALRPARGAMFSARPLNTSYAAIIYLTPLPVMHAELHESNLGTTFYVYDVAKRRSQKCTYKELATQCHILRMMAPGQPMDLAYMTCSTCALRGPACVSLQVLYKFPQLSGMYSSRLDPEARYATLPNKIYSEDVDQVDGGGNNHGLKDMLLNMKSERFTGVDPGYLDRGYRAAGSIQKDTVAHFSKLNSGALTRRSVLGRKEEVEGNLEAMHSGLRARNRVCGVSGADGECFFAGTCKRYDTCSSRVAHPREWEEQGAAAFKALGDEAMHLLKFTAEMSKIVRSGLGSWSHVGHAGGYWRGNSSELRLHEFTFELYHRYLRKPIIRYQASLHEVLKALDLMDPAIASQVAYAWEHTYEKGEQEDAWAVAGWQIYELQRLHGRVPHPDTQPGWGGLRCGAYVVKENYQDVPVAHAISDRQSRISRLFFYEAVFNSYPTWEPTLFKI